MFGECFIGKAVELAGCYVSLDLLIKLSTIERLEPSPEFRELVGGKLFDGLFEFFNGHGNIIAQMVPTAHAFSDFSDSHVLISD